MGNQRYRIAFQFLEQDGWIAEEHRVGLEIGHHVDFEMIQNVLADQGLTYPAELAMRCPCFNYQGLVILDLTQMNGDQIHPAYFNDHVVGKLVHAQYI